MLYPKPQHQAPRIMDKISGSAQHRSSALSNSASQMKNGAEHPDIKQHPAKGVRAGGGGWVEVCRRPPCVAPNLRVRPRLPHTSQSALKRTQTNAYRRHYRIAPASGEAITLILLTSPRSIVMTSFADADLRHPSPRTRTQVRASATATGPADARGWLSALASGTKLMREIEGKDSRHCP